MFILWQYALARLKRNAFKVKKKTKNGSEWFKLNERLVSLIQAVKLQVLYLNSAYTFLLHR